MQVTEKHVHLYIQTVSLYNSLNYFMSSAYIFLNWLYENKCNIMLRAHISRCICPLMRVF